MDRYPVITALRRRIPSLALFMGFGLLSVITGVLIATKGPVAGFGLILAVMGAATVVIPMALVFRILIIAAFLLVGPLQYFGDIEKIFWLPYLVGLLILLRSCATHFFRNSATFSLKAKKPEFFGLSTLIGLYMLTLLASTVFNRSPILQVLLSLKEYFFLMGVGLAIVWGMIRIDFVDQLLQRSHWLLVIQLPVIAYQHFVIAANRIGPSPWDSVVGLMSGDPNGGGASATMVLLAIVIMTYHLASWRAGLLETAKLILVMSLGMASIMLTEVKVAIFLLPFSFGLVYFKEIIRRPLFGMSFLAVTVSLSLLVLFSYQKQFADSRTNSANSVTAYVEQVFDRSTGGEQVNMATGEMGRVAALNFWWKNHHIDEPLYFFMGHGIGASRLGQITGDTAKQYNFKIGRSTFVILLWEGGVIVAGTIVLILLLTVFAGAMRANSAASASDRVAYQASSIGLLLTVVMLPYGTDLFAVAQAQLLAILLLARIATAPPDVGQ